MGSIRGGWNGLRSCAVNKQTALRCMGSGLQLNLYYLHSLHGPDLRLHEHTAVTTQDCDC